MSTARSRPPNFLFLDKMSRNSKRFKRRVAPMTPGTPLSRSVSMRDPEDHVSDINNVLPTLSSTATPSMMDRWKKQISLKRGRRQDSYSAPNINFTCDDAAIFDEVNVMKFHQHMNNEYSINDSPEKILSNERIRTIIQNTMKKYGGNMDILKTIENNDCDVRLLLNPYNPAEKNVALLWACFLRCNELLPFLVHDVDLGFYTEEEGLTALHLAAYSASPSCVRLLLKIGAVNSKPKSLTPLHCAAMGNSTECIQLLLNTGSYNNFNILNSKDVTIMPERADSPLHSAICANAPDCVALLLDSGADATAVGENNLPALHLAAHLGFTECVSKILNSKRGIDVNAKAPDKRGYTSLHFAVRSRCEEIVRLLLNHGGNPNDKNSKGQTALHIAAKMQAVECVKILIPESDINAIDADGRTALHTAVCAIGAAETVEVLCKERIIDLNKSDNNGRTALHIAATNELPTVAAILIRRGADVTARTKRGATALGLVIRKAPAALYAIEEVLNSAISISMDTVNVDLMFDFRPLLQGNKRTEISLLSTFIAEGQKSLLEHPICKAFLHLKWQTIRKFYAVRLFLSFLFVIFLSLYSLLFLTNDYTFFGCVSSASKTTQYDENERLKNGNKTLSASTLDRYPREQSEILTESCTNDIETVLKILKCVVNWGILCLALMEIMRKLFGLVSFISAPTVHSVLQALKNYVCQIDNILEWFTSISVLLISNLIWQEKWKWQEHLCPFVVLFGWTNLMMVVGQLPLFGAYVAMYTCVLREFVKLLLAYLCLLIGFAISFCVIFKEAKEFSNPLIAFVKVLVMMTGELEFNDLIVEKNRVNTTESLEVKFLPFTTPVIFVACLLLLTVTLMNLLVAIAVHDIKSLRVSADLSKLENQSVLVCYVETALSVLKSCSSVFSTELSKKIITKKFKFSTILHLENIDHEDNNLPREIIQEAYELAEQCDNVDKIKNLDPRNSIEQVDYTVNTMKHKNNKSVPLPSRNPRLRRTMYIKVDDKVNDQNTELKHETLATLKQISEENQAALSEMRGMLTQILESNHMPSSQPTDHNRRY